MRLGQTRQEDNHLTAQALTSAGSARATLREATASEHAAVDAVFSHFDLGRSDGYRAFLEAQHRCIGPVEAALANARAEAVLPDWPERRRAPLLAADLADLDSAGPGRADPSALPLSTPAAVLGTIYVLEGSRFGGAALARRLAPGVPDRFLRAHARPGAWRALLAALDRMLVRERDMTEAVAAARAVFALFETAGRDRLGASAWLTTT